MPPKLVWSAPSSSRHSLSHCQATRIVEQDKAAKCIAFRISGHDVWVFFASHLEADSVAKRRKALRWANGAQGYLGAQVGRVH